jgi:hypothetical protein
MAESAKTDRAPPPETKEPRSDEEFLRRARKRFDRASSAESVNRREAIEDLKFKKGDQWPESIRADRTIQKRPCLTINKVKTFIHQITNDQRQNRPAISVTPVGEKGDRKTAQMLRGLIKQIERNSNADVAYDTGFDNAVTNGWGYWRVVTDYEGEDSFDQVIKIARIRNPFRVYLDPEHQEPDGSDAKWGFISDLMPRAEFEAMYKGADPMPWDAGGTGDEYKSWNTETHVRVAEYFVIETEKRELVLLENGHAGFEDELAEDVQAKIKASPDSVVDRRTVQKKQVKWYTITGKQILEENDWAGKYIPIVKIIGDEVDVEGKVSLAGIVRDAKDAQRMYNFWCTAETELIALAPKAPWIMEEGQVEGHESRWRDSNVKSFPYLLYKGTNVGGKQAPPPQRQPFAGSPQGVVAAKIGAAQDMQATTGIRFDATQQERMYDESGKALRELKRVGDLGNFHYVDNLARSLRHTGRILIDLIPKIYDTARVLTILREDDSEERVRIEPSLMKPHGEETGPDGKSRNLFNPKLGEYEVMVTIGPSFATKRAEAADSMLAFMKTVPQAAPIVGDLIAKNMDWPGAEEISVRLAMMLPPQIQALLGKQLKDFPPEAKALIMGMQGQLQQLGQQHQMAVKALNDQNADRAVEYAKIEEKRQKDQHDFEAKMAKIAADHHKEMIGHINGRMDKIVDHVHKIEQMSQGHESEMAIMEMARKAAGGISGNGGARQ